MMLLHGLEGNSMSQMDTTKFFPGQFHATKDRNGHMSKMILSKKN